MASYKLKGFCVDKSGNKYDFRHAIIVMTTTLGSERIATLMDKHPAQQPMQTLDLIQLVLNDHSQAEVTNHQLTSEEICNDIMPTLEAYFSTKFLCHFHVVPFLPLDRGALEKIIRGKLTNLMKRLEMTFGIELTYAPEVVRFLAEEAWGIHENTKAIDKLFEQHVYTSVAHEIVLHIEDKNRSKRLVIQLNDTGQMLRCEFIHEHEVAAYPI